MLFQYKANEELVRSVYKTQMGEKVAEQLTKMGIEYCPLITQVRQWSDRKKK
jgi:DNA-binding HxlR family transcriptional regulator